MSGLGVHGDPGGWQHAGYTLRAAVTQLTAELQTADAVGGSGLRPAWQGPMAESYLAVWRTRHGHYADLIYQVGRASGALIDFGERLADFQVRAAHLESHWLGMGLHLTADGLQFTLPHGYAGLAHEVLATLRGFEAEAASDVTAMWHDIAGAVADVVTILESVINALADYQDLSYAAVNATLGWTFNTTVDDWKKKPWEAGLDFIFNRMEAIGIRADHNLDVAKELAAKWSKDADSDVRRAGRSLVLDAQERVDAVDGLNEVGKWGGRALAVVAVGCAVIQTAKTAHKKGWINSIEDHSGDLASAVAGVGVVIGTDALVSTAVVAGATAAAPVLVPVGIVVAGGLVCAGFGAVVKHEVDHHRAGTTRALTGIGDGIRDAAVWTGDHTGLIPQPAS
jgi:hypothetical protein